MAGRNNCWDMYFFFLFLIAFEVFFVSGFVLSPLELSWFGIIFYSMFFFVFFYPLPLGWGIIVEPGVLFYSIPQGMILFYQHSDCLT